MKNLFPGLPPDLSTASAEELEQLLAKYREIAAKLGDRDPETIGDLTMAQVLEQFQAGVEDIEKIMSELDERGEIDKEFEGKLSELSAKAGLEVSAESDDGDDDDEDEAVEEPEAEVVAEETVEEAPAEAEVEAVDAEVVAASAARMKARPALPKPPKEHEPVEAVDRTPGFVASAGIPGVAEDAVFANPTELAKAIIRKREQSTSTPKGVTEKVVVASANYGEAWPEERILRGDSKDNEKVHAVTSPEALVASGGLCAPVSNYYEIRNVSSAARPVRDALAGFNATRGGLKFTQAISHAEITEEDGGVGIKTAEEDAAGGTTAEKSCQVIECPEFDEVQLEMIYKCLQFGNLNSRAWPEMVSAFVDAATAAHASLAETSTLDQMKDFSTAVTGNDSYGATSSLLYSIILSAAGMRSRHRLPDGVVLRAVLPAWTADLLIVDLIHSQFERFNKTRDGVISLIRELANVQVSFTLDGATGDSQVFGAQSAGAQLKFPTTVKFFLYPEGSFLFLDGGTLDLGIVRDSVLNNTNDYRMFAETFEVVAFIGIESQYITTTVCPDGTVAAAATAITC